MNNNYNNRSKNGEQMDITLHILYAYFVGKIGTAKIFITVYVGYCFNIISTGEKKLNTY